MWSDGESVGPVGALSGAVRPGHGRRVVSPEFSSLPSSVVRPSIFDSFVDRGESARGRASERVRERERERGRDTLRGETERTGDPWLDVHASKLSSTERNVALRHKNVLVNVQTPRTCLFTKEARLVPGVPDVFPFSFL